MKHTNTARKTPLKISIVTAFASAFLGAAAALLLVSSLTTPTRQSSYITRVEGVNENGVFILGLGVLGGCTSNANGNHFLRATFGNERDADCGKTYGNDYQSVLLLPPLNEGVFNSSTLSNDPYPYSINVPYRVVEYSMTRGMVMVPIAAAFAIIAMLMFIFGSYKMAGWADWATTMLSALAAILGWASFGIAYQLTDKVRESLEEYNRNGLNNGFTLASIRGNATWILLAGTILATVAVPLIVARQVMVKRSRPSANIARKSSNGEEHEMELA